MKIGITGSIACGKSTVSGFLRESGYAVIDADAISHALTAPGGDALGAIRAAFGSGVFSGDALNRRALGAVVFSDAKKRAQLDAILHPMILSRIAAALSAQDAPGKLVFADVPLLFECAMEDWFDRIWVVSAKEDTQLERLMARDGLSRDAALARIRSQMPLEEKRRRADDVIHTDAEIPETQRQVLSLLASIQERSQA